MVNRQTLEGHWNEITGKLQKRWGQLTDDELREARGSTDQLVGLIQRKTGETREAIEHYLDELAEQSSSRFGQAAGTARQYAAQASERVSEASERLGTSMRSGYGRAEEFLHERPAESLAVVFGVGLVAGLIVGLTLRR